MRFPRDLGVRSGPDRSTIHGTVVLNVQVISEVPHPEPRTGTRETATSLIEFPPKLHGEKVALFVFVKLQLQQISSEPAILAAPRSQVVIGGLGIQTLRNLNVYAEQPLIEGSDELGSAIEAG